MNQIPHEARSAADLPAAVTSFVGREQELGDLTGLLAERRLVTLTGVGGGGKTRLALEVARRLECRHRDGVRLVELAGLRDPSLVPEAVLAALRMREPVGRTATEQLCASLAHRDLLLVLDNCEHAIDDVAALVGELLAACANLRVLATSREALRIPGEVERSLASLGRPDADVRIPPDQLLEFEAVRLLVERGSDVRQGFRIGDGNAAAIAKISVALDGIPLAIELVAARLRTLSVDQIAAQLGEQMRLLAWEGRGRPDRQQTMRATLDWSHAQLSAEEQRVFRRLSIFAGGFTLDAADEVVGNDARVVVEALAGKSLIEVDHARDEPRLHMLEPVRQYAADELRDADEREEISARHVEWVVRLAEQAGRGFMSEQSVWGARLRDEQHNIRQALELALQDERSNTALRIAAPLGYPWFTMGQPDARRWMARALDAGREAPPRIRGLALFGAGLLAESALDFDEALRLLGEALEIARHARSRRLQGWVLNALGRAAWAVDVHGKLALAWFEEALQTFREIDEPVGVGWMLTLLADISTDAGNLEQAASQAREALEIGKRSGILSVVGDAQRILSEVAAKQGDFVDAHRILSEATANYERVGDRFQLSVILETKAFIQLSSGEVAGALVSVRESLRLARDVGSGERTLYALGTSARALFEQGRTADAATLVGAVEAANANLPNRADWFRNHSKARSFVENAGLDAQRSAGMQLSPEQATELALRFLGEEIAKVQAVELGRAEAESATSIGVGESTRFLFRRDGDFWTIAYAGKEIRLRDLRGLHYLATLLREPGREFHSGDLVRSGRGPSFAPQLDDTLAVTIGTGDAGARLDARARAAYKARLEALDDEITEAERRNDRGHLERAREEREALLAELGAAARGKRASSDAERARLTATKGLKAALDKIAASHPELGAHLHATVRRGYFCSYVPDPRHPIEWEA